MLFSLLGGTRKTVLIRAGAMIALIAFADWRIEGNIPIGFLYLFPMLLMGSILSRWQIAATAILCSFLTETFDSYEWLPESGVPRDIMVFAAFFGMGIFVYEVVRSRQVALTHLRQIESESEARRDAEEQLEILVESSPAAIFTANEKGDVLLANDAAHRMFALLPGSMAGKPIRQFLPSLVNVPALDENRQSFRTVMQGRGRRQNGQVFLADIWFSTYKTSAGPRLAAMVIDTSEDLRTREEFSLNQLLASSRILVGAVSHEIRNVCGAIAVVHENLARGGTLAGNKDFEALGTLILALEKIAGMDLRQSANQAANMDLQSFLEELRIIVEPSLQEDGIDLQWEIKPGLPMVWADRQSLVQVFLNLTKNAARAMEGRPVRELAIVACPAKHGASVRIRDTGCGVKNPERLFRPFQPGAQATGLGLYLSRAFMRSFRGDLRFEPEPQGSSFIVELWPRQMPADSSAMHRQIQILLVDDHSLFRESLSRLLEAEPDYKIVGNCASATEAIQLLKATPVDLVLLDYDLGDEQGSGFLTEAKREGFTGKILMVTAGMSDTGTLRALEGGAAGIFLKHSPPSQLVEAIEKVMNGEVWLDSKAVRSLIAGANSKSEEQRTSQPLSSRERMVLKSVFEGLTNKEIAALLEISESSVKAVLQQLFDKTGVRSRSQLVRIALEQHSQDWLKAD